jgi:hypothetical protein
MLDLWELNVKIDFKFRLWEVEFATFVSSYNLAMKKRRRHSNGTDRTECDSYGVSNVCSRLTEHRFTEVLSLLAWFVQCLVAQPCMKNLLIHLAVCLTTGPKPLSKRALYIVRSRASSFRCEYPLLSFWSSSSFLRLLPRLPVTYIPPFIFPSVTCCRRMYVRKMWPIQLAFRLLISCRIFLCPWLLSNTYFFISYMIGPTDLRPSPVPHFRTFQVIYIYIYIC